MNGIWVSSDIPRIDGRKPSSGTPAATRLVPLGLIDPPLILRSETRTEFL